MANNERTFISSKLMHLCVGTFSTFIGAIGSPLGVKRTTSTANQVHVVHFDIQSPFISGVGTYLKSVELLLKTATATLTAALNAHIHRVDSYKAVIGGGTAISASSIPLTQTGNNTTLQNDKRLIAQVTTQAFNYTSTITEAYYHFSACIPCKCLTDVTIYGAWVDYFRPQYSQA